MKAYFTVEAALILPIVFGIYLLIIYGMFFQYDRCLLEQEIAAITLRGAVFPEGDNMERAFEMKRQEASFEEDRYLAFKRDEMKLTAGNGKVCATRQGRVEVPFAGIGAWLSGGDFMVSASYENRQISQKLFLRTARKIIEKIREENNASDGIYQES